MNFLIHIAFRRSQLAMPMTFDPCLDAFLSANLTIGWTRLSRPRYVFSQSHLTCRYLSFLI
eukprot:scaffold520382_cov29-Prasinocladus_malaysianus.AAC.1